MGKSKYQIQFQKGLGLPQFYEFFGTEEQCERHVEQLKWPQGFICPKCGGTQYSQFRRNERLYYQCSSCRHQSSLTSDTIFHGSHLPLRIWFTALYLVSEAKTQLSSLELHRLIHVNHKTAWLMLHKIMEVMQLAEEDRTLSGRIEMDDAYLGGKRKGGKSGRGAPDKQPFIAAVQTTYDKKEPRPHYLKLAPVKTFSCNEVRSWTRQHISPGSHVVTDALGCFSGVEETCSHEIHIASKMNEEEKEQHFKWVNTILCNVKTGLTGSFHSFECTKYSMRYLAAIVFRFNHRFDLNLIFRELVHYAVKSPPMTIHSVRL